MRLIGINGFKTSGKDTTYGLVKKMQADKNVQRVAFADKLKIIGAKALGYDGDDAALIDLMDDFKENGHMVCQFNQLGGNSFDDTIIGDPKRLNVLNGRQYLQYLGAEARNVFEDTFWIDRILPRPSEHPSRGNRQVDNFRALTKMYPDVDILCVTDVRYPNEAERILRLGGEIWEVIRPGLDSDGHSSEIPLPRDLVTHTIENDSHIDALAYKVRDLL
jgi:hypothetical protein